MTNDDLYKIALYSLIANVVLLFCLTSPNIVYFIHRRWFSWCNKEIEIKNEKQSNGILREESIGDATKQGRIN